MRESSESSWLLWRCDTKPWRAINKNRVVDLKFFGRLLPWFTAPRGCGASSEPQLRAGMSLSRGVKLRRYFRLCESSPVNQDVADNGQGCLGRASGQLAVKVPLLIWKKCCFSWKCLHWSWSPSKHDNTYDGYSEEMMLSAAWWASSDFLCIHASNAKECLNEIQLFYPSIISIFFINIPNKLENKKNNHTYLIFHESKSSIFYLIIRAPWCFVSSWLSV